MTADLDQMIARDLGALGDANLRGIPDRANALHDGGIYRDGRAGAVERRDVLANERRVQLALMPLSLAQVFAHRVGRATAGATAIVCALAIFGLTADPFAQRVLAWLVPGIGVNVGMCAIACACVVLAAYVVGTWAAEAWFTHRMRKAVQLGGDVFEDLDQLARGPIELARQLSRRVDGWAAGLWLGGIAALVGVFGYLVAIALAVAPPEYLLSTTSVFDVRITWFSLGPVAYGLALAAIASVVLGRACAREHRIGERPSVLAFAGNLGTLGLAGLGLAITAYNVMRMTQVGGYLTSEIRYGTALLGEASVLAVGAFAILWWRAREARRIGEI